MPRGYGITAAVANAILMNLQTQARSMGRRTVVSPYRGAPDVIFKMVKTPENWVRWGLAHASVETYDAKTTCHIDVPSTPELTPRWMPQSYGTGSASSTQTAGTPIMMDTHSRPMVL